MRWITVKPTILKISICRDCWVFESPYPWLKMLSKLEKNYYEREFSINNQVFLFINQLYNYQKKLLIIA